MPAPLAGSLIGPAVTVAKDSYKAAKPQYDYVNDIDENFENLQSAITSLNASEGDVKDEVKRNSNTKVMTGQCRLCLDRVEKTNESFTELQEKYQNTKRYLFGLWPFFKLRKLGKDIVKLTKEVITRSEEMTKLQLTNNVMKTREPKPVELRHSINVLELSSQAEKVKQLLDHLRDVTVRRIGLFGLEGIGKTTIMEKLYKKVTKKTEFGMTFFISVPGEDNPRKVQEDLLRQLGLPIIDTHSSEQVADIISKEIENVKYLLLLDQVSSAISLDAVGIRDYHRNGKVVIASNKRQICKDMGADEFLKVEPLSFEDAHKLFGSIVGDVTIRQRIGNVAKQIVKNLIRLPRAIILVAVTLKREKEENKWNIILQALTDPISDEQHHLEDLNKMFTNLFNQLHSRQRICLFYASLFPSEYEIHEDYLVECWINERFISNDSPVDQQPFRRSHDRGHATLTHLIEASLLERCRSKLKYIMMPEQIRKLSLEAIVQVDESKPLVVTSQQRPEEDWKHAKRISLMCNNFRILPQSPTNCSKTRTLLLQKNSQLEHISKSFFAHMCELQVLDLYASSIKSLPQSLFDLTSLQGLYLNHCKQLTSLPSKIEKLENLKLLDIRETGIRRLPKTIGKLSELKCFRVSLLSNGSERPSRNPIKNLFKRKKVPIPKNLIKKLSKLEELTIIIDPNERSWNEIAGNIVEEIASLEVLTTLYFNFPGVDNLVSFVKTSKSWKNKTTAWGKNTYRSYKMLVGHGGVSKHQNLDHSERLLRFCSGEDIPAEIMIVLKQASAFELIGHSKVQSLAEFGPENLTDLEVCVIEECNKMKSVIVKGSMVNLTTLVLKGCAMITTILTPEFAQQLKQLKRLRVENCSRVVLIIGSETNSHILAVDESKNISPLAEIDNGDNPLMVNSLPLILNGAGNHSQAPKINETKNPSADLEKSEAEDEKSLAENQSMVHDIIGAKKGSRVNISPLAEIDNGDNPLMLTARSCNLAESSDAKVNSLPFISNGAGNRLQAPEINEIENFSADLEKIEAEDEKILAENQSKFCDIMVAKRGSRATQNIDVVGEKKAQNHPRVGEIVEAEIHAGTGETSEARNKSRVSEIREVELTPYQSINAETIKVETHSRINEINEARNHLRVSKIVEEESDSRRAETENIAGTVRIENPAGAFPKLESLELVDLPLLSAICESDVLSWLALENIVIQKCKKFKTLSSITMKSEELCSIRCTNSFWEAQVWPNDHLKQRLQLLCHFFQDESPNNPSSSTVVASSPTSCCASGKST